MFIDAGLLINLKRSSPLRYKQKVDEYLKAGSTYGAIAQAMADSREIIDTRGPLPGIRPSRKKRRGKKDHSESAGLQTDFVRETA
jgi:hypothetical protein